MGCDCKKTYNIGMGCCQPVLAPADNYYTKYQVDQLIESATTSGCCITPEEVDEKIEEAISGITVSGITEEQAEEMIEEATSGKANSSDVYTKQEADALLADKQDKLIAGQGISISDSNVISTSGSVTNVIPFARGSEAVGHISFAVLGGTEPGLKTLAREGSGITIDRDHKINVNWNVAQRKLSAGTGIDITDNVISVTGGSQPVDAYTKAESDAKFATITNLDSHSGNTTVHITAQERTTWNAKPNVWCGSESEWSQISGSTEQGTIYLVY